MARATGPERRLLAIYTGGTIGMRSEGGVLVPGRGLAAVLRTLHMFHDEEYARAHSLPEDTLVLPPASPDQRIIYTVLECQPLFDSSDMTITEDTTHSTRALWSSMARTPWPLLPQRSLSCWKTCRNRSSSRVPRYLSMHCGVTAVRTCWGLCSWLASTSSLRSVYSSRINSFGAIGQPRWTLGVNRELVRKASGKSHLVVHSSMEPDVGLLRLYPGIPASLVRTFLQPPLKGVVMETFGSGNGPTKPDLLQELRVAAEQGLIIVNCTHCLQGAVTSDYASGMAMAGAGIVSGFDMTSEAALAKLSYVLGQPGLSMNDRKKLLARDLRGEMTLPTRDGSQDGMLGCRVAWLLNMSGTQEADAIKDVLLPGLALAAAHDGDPDTLQAFVELGKDLNLKDYRGQTPLHLAARRGHAAVVTMLLQRGVDVNAHDEDGQSPLLLAVRGRHQCVIELLRAAGARLSPQELEDVGTELCRLASRADSEGLRAWWQAGADLDQLDYDGHSALQVVSLPCRLKQLGIQMWWPCYRALRKGSVLSPRPTRSWAGLIAPQ
ncbi:60 kDa lysophospholipase isoform X6 [Arvicanthis niloticus]|uniref:60 kDa lysophospholipase isoform X5 n=1 Tax=Arvicanthis niloticus TaxID=61156 RepID=UPI00402BB9DD